MKGRSKIMAVTLFCMLLAVVFLIYKSVKNPSVSDRTIGNSKSDQVSPVIQKNSAGQQYEAGYVLVSFKDGTTYKQASDLLQGYGLSIKDTNSYWKATNFVPTDSTVLKSKDVFKVYAGVGKEDGMVETLNKNVLVRAAEKDFTAKVQK